MFAPALAHFSTIVIVDLVHYCAHFRCKMISAEYLADLFKCFLINHKLPPDFVLVPEDREIKSAYILPVHKEIVPESSLICKSALLDDSL